MARTQSRSVNFLFRPSAIVLATLDLDDRRGTDDVQSKRDIRRACFTHKKQTAGAQKRKQTRTRLATCATSNGSSSDENWQ